MATTIEALPNQSMSDLVIQGTGSMEACMQFCFDNSVAISDVPEVGTIYQVSDAALALGDPGVLQYLAQNGIVIGTLGTAPPEPVLLAEDGPTLLAEDGATPLEAE